LPRLLTTTVRVLPNPGAAIHNRRFDVHVERPALVAGDALALALPPLAMAVEVAVLELDSGSLRVSAMNRTSNSLVLERSVSICHCGLMPR
jgi:hypothetical protein